MATALCGITDTAGDKTLAVSLVCVTLFSWFVAKRGDKVSVLQGKSPRERRLRGLGNKQHEET